MYLSVKAFNKQLKNTGINAKKLSLNFHGVQVKFGNPLSIRNFRTHGTTCACCGREAVGYMLEKSSYNYKGNKKLEKLYPVLRLFGYEPNGRKFFFNVDHIIPKSRGGQHVTMSNLQTQCVDCNSKKGNMLPSEELLGRNWFEKIPTEISNAQVDLFTTEYLSEAI